MQKMTNPEMQSLKITFHMKCCIARSTYQYYIITQHTPNLIKITYLIVKTLIIVFMSFSRRKGAPADSVIKLYEQNNFLLIFAYAKLLFTLHVI